MHLPRALPRLSALTALLSALVLGCTPAPTTPNIVLVSIDTFRADRVGAFGFDGERTPNIDRFAAQAVSFPRAYSQITVTAPSHLSVFTGLYPADINAASRNPSAVGLTTLAKVLGVYGYQTAARTAGGDLSPEAGPTVGFDSYASSVHFGSLHHTVPMAMEWLDGAERGRPFFLFIHGYDTHTTYMKPPPYGLLHTGLSTLTREQEVLSHATERVVDGKLHPSFLLIEDARHAGTRPRSPAAVAAMAEAVSHLPLPAPVVSETDQALIGHLYDGAVSYADAQFGLLLAELEARGRFEDSVIVLMGDHGEALGEHGMYHRCCTVDDATTHVPLLVRLPHGERGGTEVSAVVELVDLMPTLLDLVGAVPPAGIRGVSLVPAMRGAPDGLPPIAFSQAAPGVQSISARSLAGRLTYTGLPLGSALLPDMITSAALPGPSFEAEEGATPADQEALRTALAAWARTMPPVQTKEEVALPAELRASLREHGYWDAK